MKARVRRGNYGSESDEEDSGEERLMQAKKEVGFTCAVAGKFPGSKKIHE